ncbi:MAG: TlpA family protein disulfide reductase [Ginsengibacter sp.]
MKTFLIFFVSAITLSSNAQVEVSGVVKNFTDSAFYITQIGGFNNFTRVWQDTRVKVPIDKNKTFKVIVPEESIGTWYIKTGNEKQIQMFDFVKGENQRMDVDFSKPYPLHAIGKNAGDFNYSAFLLDSVESYYSKNDYFKKTRIKNIDSVLFYRKKFASYKLNLLRKFRSTHVMSDTYCKWLQSKYSYEPFERTLVENIKNRDSLDDATISKLMQKGINDEYAALNTGEYNDLVDFYIASRLNRKSKKLTLADRFNYVADSNIISGSTRDVYLSRFMAWLIKKPDSIYDPLFKKYDKIVHNKKMKQLVISRRNDYETPKTEYAINISDTKINSLTDIFKKYRGKVIYVDFWASWCVPCRAEMPNAADLKQKLNGKNIVFLYLGYNDKEKAWLKARKQIGIEGEHYLLNDKMIKEADELFVINGIPHYAIIDRDGRIISKNAGRPSEVYKQLLKLVSK